VKIQVNGITLHIFQKPATRNPRSAILLFLHYFGGSSRAWSGVIDQLANHYHCIAFDLRGFGNSDAPDTGYAMSEMADDVAELIRSLNVERFHLIGHSMGGKIALTFAARQPTGLLSLVLLAPSPPTPEPMDDSERTRLLSSHGNRAAATETARKIVARPLSPQADEQIIEDTLRTSRPAWRAWLEHGSREDISVLMPKIIVPVLVAVGAADEVLPADLLEREVVQRISGARLAVVPGTVGHLLPLEAPGATAKLIRESLTDSPLSAPRPLSTRTRRA